MFSITLIAFTFFQSLDSDYVLMRGGIFDARNAALVDTIAIVRPVSRESLSERLTQEPDRTVRKRSDGTRSVIKGQKFLGDYTVDEALVTASNRLERSKKIFIVSQSPRRGEELFALIPGQQYLVLLMAQKDGRLLQPFSFGGFDRVDPRKMVSQPLINWTVAMRPNEISGLIAFRTKSHTILQGSSYENSVISNVVECLKGADAEDTARVCAFLSRAGSRPTDLGVHFPVRPSPDTPLTKTIKQIAATSPAYQKARMMQLLLTWRVVGSEQLFVDALIGTVDDPNAFMGPLDDLSSVNLAAGSLNALEALKLVPRIDANRWADIVTSAKSPRVQEFFLAQLGGLPDEARLRKIASLVRSPHSEVRLRTAFFLSAVLEEPSKEPRAEIVNRSQEWVNLDEVIAYWIKRFNL